MFGKMPRGASERPKKSPEQKLIPSWLGMMFLILMALAVAIVLALWRPWQPVQPVNTNGNGYSQPVGTMSDSETNHDYKFYDLLPKQKVTPIPEQAVPSAQQQPVVVVESPYDATEATSSDAADTSDTVTQPETPATQTPAAPLYILQVRSFEDAESADARRDEIVLNGLSAEVVIANEKNKIWYRVISGPYTSEASARSAQLTLQNVGIDSIIVKQKD